MKLASLPGARAAVDTSPANSANCAGVRLNSCKLPGPSETQQRGLRFRDALTWASLALISLGQVAIIYWLVR